MPISRVDAEPLAWMGGRLATGLVDVTADLSALDGSGYWVVVLPFAGPPLCARFERVRVAPPPVAAPWSGPRVTDWTSSLDRDAFQQRVHRIRSVIAAGGVYQVNLTRRLSAPLASTASAPSLFAALRRGNPAPHAALVQLPARDVWIASASPELFLGRDGDLVWSSPIKGTAATADGFLDKDAAENVMIVDLVRNDLGRVCEPGSIEVPDLMRVEPHPGLFHLVSTVRGRLRAAHGWPELLAATFPPGSVTGAPKLAALDLIAALEPVPRGVYCGAVGWVDADRRRAELNVAIRTLWREDGALHLGTGGGITYGSLADGEWAETELKAANLLRVAAC